MNREEIIKEISDLMETKRFAAVRVLLTEYNPSDLADFFDYVSKEHLLILYRILPKELASEVFVEMSVDQQKFLIDSFSEFELKQILNEMYTDDTADLIEEMPANVAHRILETADPAIRHEVNELLKYSEDSAGSIMTTEYVALKRHMKVEEALNYIRTVAIDKETVYNSYVVDEKRRLVGLVTAKDLLISPVDAVIQDIMESHVISAETNTDREAVARMFDKYNFLALPVVDAENRLVGIVTVDDAIDVIHEETEEDFAKMAAITPIDKTYMRTSVLEIWRTRIPWLLLLMISSTFTGWIISSFESALAASVVLTSFIPMLMGTGGNCGSQSSVAIIRGISLGEITFRDSLHVLFKEFRVSILCGITLGIVTFIKLQFFDRFLMNNEDVTFTISIIVCLTLFMTVLCAKIIGSFLPLVAKKIGFDPAVMASPFITTLVDAISLLVYFSVARSFLPI